MKKFWILPAVLFTLISCKSTPTKDAIDKKIDALLKQMTIEEKVGQMTQLDLTLYLADSINAHFNNTDTFVIDTTKLISLLDKYYIGSFLNANAISSKAWYEYSKQLQEVNMRHSRLKIPIVYGIDHIHGATYLAEGTIFPHAISLACSYNPDLAFQMGQTTVLETAHLGHHWVFNPVLDIARNKYWPRMHETYGEDAYLASRMGEMYVKGIQDTTATAPYKVAACAKHYLGYSASYSGWDRSPSEISQQTLQEIYIPSFKAAIDAGVKTVMINSGEINGIPVHASYKYLTTILRNQLGFKGVAVTDWEDIISLWKGHKVAANEKEATYMAIMAGVDMSMVPYSTHFCDYLTELVNEGRISEERIDLSVRRILRLKFELGLFEQPYPSDEYFNRAATPENIAKAKNAVRESIVLLKNKGAILPLTLNDKIVLAGPTADRKQALTGGWTYRWMPTDENIFPKTMSSLSQALELSFGKNLVNATQKDIKVKASTAKAIVLALGEPNAYSEGFNSIVDLDLSDEQQELLDLATSTGKPVIVILLEGRPRTFPRYVDKTDAIIYAGLPGIYGAEIITEILTGKTNPSGKMSFSYPMYQGHQLNYNYKPSAFSYLHTLDSNLNRWTIGEFGSGLSYTSFEYSNLILSDSLMTAKDTLIATVTVKNTGNIAGKESVLWFLRDDVAPITRPVKELKHFEKKELAPGDKATYSFSITANSLAYPDPQGKPVLSGDYYTLTVGKLSQKFKVNP